MAKLGVTGFAVNRSGVINTSVSITGAGADAATSQPGTSLPTGKRSLGVTGFNRPEVNFQAPVGDVFVSITGAEIRARGEELEGSNVTIRIDGAASLAIAGYTTNPEIPDNARRGDAYVIIARSDRYTVDIDADRQSFGVSAENYSFSTIAEALESQVRSENTEIDA